MFLRSITVRGFKSFADKTALEFEPGISVIVGPNGSGKSNIADAIAWVLGEQGPRALRGGQMTDVIFAGSPGRPALGMAEVRMVIDNSAGLIPIPASEVEISRSVFRSGESEYRLGGRPCRLLDIQELLSDTGIGRAMHTLIGQGHLEDVLAARPEERRQFIEEAAGIAKHRRRRERAERKLAGLQGDLQRIQDLVGEVRRALRPLKQQAELAARHEALTKDAEELTRKLAAGRLRELYRDRDRRRPSWAEAENRQAEARARLEDLDRRIAELDLDRQKTDADAAVAEAGHAEALRAKSEAEVRLRRAIQAEAAARERLATASNRSGRLFALEEEMQRTERAVGEVSENLEARRAELEEAERAFLVDESARRDAEEQHRRIEEEAATRRGETETLRRSLAGHEEELARLRRARREVRIRIDESVRRVAGLQAEIEQLDAVETPLAAELSGLERNTAQLSATLGALEAQEQGLVAREEVLEARREELSQSAAAIFAKRRGDRPLGLLRDLIECPPHLQAALRGALGSFADALVYRTADDAIAEAGADGAHGLVLGIADETTPSESGAGEPLPGERRLLDSVNADPRVTGLVDALLGSTYLVRNLAEAAARRRAHPSVHFVTPEGAVAGPAFVQTPGGHDARADALMREAGALEREVASVRRRIREARQVLSAERSRAEAVRGELEVTDGLITKAADELAGGKGELTSANREEQLFVERLAAEEAMASFVSARLLETPVATRAVPPLPPMPQAPVHLRVEVEALRRERSRMEAGAERIRREVERLAADDPTALREAVSQAEAEREAADAALAAVEVGLEHAAAVHVASTGAARAALTRDAEANQAWRHEAAAAERVRRQHEEQDRARLDLERRIAEAERVLEDGHGLDPHEAVASLSPEETVEELQRQADTVARRMGLLGKVNLLAVGELGSLQERHDFLVRELEDLKSARGDLQEVVREVDRRMAELFERAFDDVSREFTELFSLLFPGGEGRLELTDPTDPLASGIEVEARPGRKRVKRLSLLSGGERSLAALAFLFAIFKARPSPFYVMDEVEAALDDVNLHRLLEVVRGFAAASQILLVTHQKRTMEIADVLYGVSMGRDGASTVISQRLAEVAVGVR
jgi:chromosome segregation protein